MTNNAAVPSRWSHSLVDDAKTLDKIIEEITASAGEFIGLGLRISNLRLSIVQLAVWDQEKGRGIVYIFDAIRMKGVHQVQEILTSTEIVKIIHSCRHGNAYLEKQYNSGLVNVFDLQVAHSVIKSQRDGQISDQVEDISLDDLCAEYGVLRNPRRVAEPVSWRRRPLTNAMIEISFVDSIVLIPLYLQMKPLISDQSSFDRMMGKKLNPEDDADVDKKQQN